MPVPNDDRDGLRRCRDCDEWRPLEEFHTSSRRPSGRGSYCKSCYNVRSKASMAKRAAVEGRVITPRQKLPEPQHVDHDHRSGRVRGILCFNCNGGLGQFRDSELFLSRAITYLRDTSYQALLIEPGVWRILPRRRRPMSSSTL